MDIDKFTKCIRVMGTPVAVKIDSCLAAAQKKGMAVVVTVRPDGTVLANLREPSQRPKLDELQSCVDGLIQPVDFYRKEAGWTGEAYANEEGLLMGLEINPGAVAWLQWHEPIVGPVVILDGFLQDDEGS